MSPGSIARIVGLGLGLGVLAVQTREFSRIREGLRREVHAEVRRTLESTRAALDRAHQEAITVVRELVADLESGWLDADVAHARLRAEVLARPSILGLAVALPNDPGEPYVVPTYLRNLEDQRTLRLDEVYDVGGSEWFKHVLAHPEPGWHAPFLGQASGHFLAIYCEPWSRPAAPAAIGHVCAALSLHEIDALRRALPARRFGYTWMLSGEARTVAHPNVDWVRAGVTPSQIAEAIGEPRLGEVERRAIEGREGVIEAIDPLTARDALFFQKVIPTSAWSLVAVILEDEVLAAEPRLRRRQVEIVVTITLTLAIAVLVVFRGGRR